MSRTTEYIIETINESEKVSNCCEFPLKEGSYSNEFNIETGLCSGCHEGCGVTVLEK